MKVLRAPIEAILFDLDGTLVDSHVAEERALVDLGRRMGLDLGLASHPLMNSIAGMRVDDAIKVLSEYASCSAPDDAVAYIRARCKTYAHRVEPMEGVVDLCASLDLPTAIVSNSPLATMEDRMRASGLSSHFVRSPLVSAYEVGRWKPDPTPYLHASKLLSVDPSKCAVVEDSPAGVAAGVAAGAQVFHFCPSYDENYEPREVVAFRKMSQLRKLIMQQIEHPSFHTNSQREPGNGI